MICSDLIYELTSCFCSCCRTALFRGEIISQLTSLLRRNLTATDVMFGTANPLLRVLLLADELLRGGQRLLLLLLQRIRLRLRRLIRIHVGWFYVVAIFVMILLLFWLKMISILAVSVLKLGCTWCCCWWRCVFGLVLCNFSVEFSISFQTMTLIHACTNNLVERTHSLTHTRANSYVYVKNFRRTHSYARCSYNGGDHSRTHTLTIRTHTSTVIQIFPFVGGGEYSFDDDVIALVMCGRGCWWYF